MKQQRRISSFAALAVFALFALCVLCVLLAGAGVYRRLVSAGQEAYAGRTAAQYISAKVRQSEAGESLSVEPFGETEALVVAAGLEDAVYCTRIYCYNGWLMELFADKTGEFAPQDGEKLIPAQSLDLSFADGLLRVTVVDELGGVSELTFALREGVGADG